MGKRVFSEIAKLSHDGVLSVDIKQKQKVKQKVSPMPAERKKRLPSFASIVRTFTAPGRNFKTDYLRYIDTYLLEGNPEREKPSTL